MWLGASTRCPARPYGRPSISHVIPLRLFQTLNVRRWNCNVFGVSRKMTVGNYVRHLVSAGSTAAFGCWGRTLRPFLRSSSLRWWGFCTTRSPLAACRRRVEPSCSAIPPDWCCLQPRVSRLGPADQAARLSETPVAFARFYPCGIETAIAFADAGRASTETAIAFAGAGRASTETAVAFARSCSCGIETAIAFAGAGRASTETVITFAGGKWVFLACFSAALVLSVSRGVV